jgi:hypothetical protein
VSSKAVSCRPSSARARFACSEASGAHYGLSNLAQLCHHVGRKEWEGAIASHFDNLFAAVDAEDEFEELSQDFERVRPLLKVRLYPSEKAPARSRRASTGGATRP